MRLTMIPLCNFCANVCKSKVFYLILLSIVYTVLVILSILLSRLFGMAMILKVYVGIIRRRWKAYCRGGQEDLMDGFEISSPIPICWTPQRLEEFARLLQEASAEETAFQPITANLPRWNSDFKARPYTGERLSNEGNFWKTDHNSTIITP